jgi:fido (protein-threonine AMPylation protein)
VGRFDTAHLKAIHVYNFQEINAAHPVREGNGRTQREFPSGAGTMKAGITLTGGRPIEEMTKASRLSRVSGDASLFEGLLRACLRGSG